MNLTAFIVIFLVYSSNSAPSSWTCDEAFYDAGDGCHCNCGYWDPDCDTQKEVIGCDSPYQLCEYDIGTYECTGPEASMTFHTDLLSSIMVVQSDWAVENFWETDVWDDEFDVTRTLSSYICDNISSDYDTLYFFGPEKYTAQTYKGWMNIGTGPYNNYGANNCDTVTNIRFNAMNSGYGPYFHELVHNWNVKITEILNMDNADGHWGYTLLDSMGQNGGYPWWAAFCRTSSGNYELIYPDPSSCVSSNGKYDLVYMDDQGSPTTSNDGFPTEMSEYELLAMGLLDTGDLTLDGLIGVDIDYNEEAWPSIEMSPTADMLAQIPAEYCEMVGLKASDTHSGCKSIEEMESTEFNNYQAIQEAICNCDNCDCDECIADGHCYCPQWDLYCSTEAGQADPDCDGLGQWSLYYCGMWTEDGWNQPFTKYTSATSLSFILNSDIQTALDGAELAVKSPGSQFKAGAVTMVPSSTDLTSTETLLAAYPDLEWMDEYIASREDAFETQTGGLATLRTNNPPFVPGCTNNVATNYNSQATVDDGSCVWPATGDDDDDQGANDSVAMLFVVLTVFLNVLYF